MLGSYNKNNKKKIEDNKFSHKVQLGELNDFISGFSYQKTSILQTQQ
jgi:hypothetical protein